MLTSVLRILPHWISWIFETPQCYIFSIPLIIYNNFMKYLYKHEFFYVVTIDDVNFERDVEDSDSSDVEDIGQEESEGEFQNFELGLNLQQL